MKRRGFLAVCVASMLLMTVHGTSQRTMRSYRQQVVKYSPSKTLLTGVLTKEQRFGPPGFGETPKTDPKVSIIVLVLERPITAVLGTGQRGKDDINVSPIRNVRHLQLWFNGEASVPTLEAFARTHIGQRVSVEGFVDEAVAPMEFTPLILTVSALTLRQ